MFCAKLWFFILVFGVWFGELSSNGGENSIFPSFFTQRNRDSFNLQMETPEVVVRYGYPVETHSVVTADGYILVVHRIPGSPKAPSSGGVKTPVLLQHALLMASDVWVATGPERGLGFLLADQGYDVWMGNARGNCYSRKHISLSPKDNAFWDFSWHEMGMYDLPATIDYILKVTRQKQLYYVGYSMGTTMFFVMASSKPEYNQKIKRMVALAPVVFDGQHSNAFEYVMLFVMNMNKHEVFPRSNAINQGVNFFCREGQITQRFCSFIYFQIFGANPKQLNTKMLPLYITRTSSGTSARVFEHFYQMFNTNKFQLLDRDARRRGSISPTPEYNLTQATAPVVLIYAENDSVITPKGVMKLSKMLPNVEKVIRVNDDSAAHDAFSFSNNVREVVYNDVMKSLT